MIVKLLAEHHLEFLSLKGGCRGSSESTLVKMSNCWKSHAQAHFVDKTGYHAVIIGLVIAAKFASNSGWITTSVWTLESYPTVIRYVHRPAHETLIFSAYA